MWLCLLLCSRRDETPLSRLHSLYIRRCLPPSLCYLLIYILLHSSKREQYRWPVIYIDNNIYFLSINKLGPILSPSIHYHIASHALHSILDTRYFILIKHQQAGLIRTAQPTTTAIRDITSISVSNAVPIITQSINLSIDQQSPPL